MALTKGCIILTKSAKEAFQNTKVGIKLMHTPMKTKSESSTKDFELFKKKIEKDFFTHPVIVNNPYTKWFKQGLANTEQVKDLILQFSVFSNHFIVVQTKRMVNATTIEGEEAARAILLNECGVGMDVKTGSIEGKRFATTNAHINWLRKMADMLDVDTKKIGRWETGTKATHDFLEGLDQTYGSRDGIIGSGASFAIETWAAFGIGEGKEAESNNFWRELTVGLEGYNKHHRIPKGLQSLPTGFFQYHFETESGHGVNVWQELKEAFNKPEFDEIKFIDAGKIALKSIYTFWLGLDETRKNLA